MKIIKYQILSCEINRGTKEEPDMRQIFVNKEIVCGSETALQANLPIAQMEAHNGEYTIEDDGETEPDTVSTDDVLNALLGVTV